MTTGWSTIQAQETRPLNKVIDGKALEYLIATLDSHRPEQKYPTRTKTLYHLPGQNWSNEENILLFHF